MGPNLLGRVRPMGGPVSVRHTGRNLWKGPLAARKPFKARRAAPGYCHSALREKTGNPLA